MHHGIWGSDIPCAPSLVDIVVDGRPIKALAQPTKQAFLYVFDRITGEPLIGIVERRHTLPVLGHVLLRRAGGRVELTTSDLERQVSHSADLGGDAADETSPVPAFKLHEILRALPAGQRVTLAAGRDRLTLRSGGSRFTLRTSG